MAKLVTDRKISVLESYKDYKEKYPKEHKNYLSKSDFNKVVKMLGAQYAYLAITTGRQVKFPVMFGALQMVKYKPTNKLVDFNKTREVYGEHNRLNPKNKKSVKHTNRITKGYLPSVWWKRDKYVASFRNKNVYVFQFSRPNLRPNAYNKNNPKASLIPFFQEQGFRMYPLRTQIKNNKI